MGLAGYEQLDRPRLVEQERFEAVHIPEEERGPLVGGETAGEADGERVGTQRWMGRRSHSRRASPLARLRIGLLPCVGHQAFAQAAVSVPELQVGNAFHPLPGLPGRRVLPPSRSQIVIVELPHLGRHPGLGMHPVRDRFDGHISRREVRPPDLHHAGGHPAMQAADGIAPRRLAQGQRRHVEVLVRVAVDPPHAHELLDIQPQFLQVGAQVIVDEFLREQVEPRRDRRVGSEERTCAGDLAGFHERQP